MTVQPPETDGQTPMGDRGGDQGATQSMDLQAPMDASIPAEFATSEAEAHAWQGQAKTMMDSDAGFGGSGYSVLMPDTDGDAQWPADVSFPHQGP